MKYTIAAVNQIGIANAGLADGDTDLVDWAIIDYIQTWAGNPRSTRRGDLVWISYKHLIREMPLLGLRTKQSVSKRITNLAKIGLLRLEHDQDGRVFAGLTNKCHDAVNFSTTPSTVVDTPSTVVDIQQSLSETVNQSIKNKDAHPSDAQPVVGEPTWETQKPLKSASALFRPALIDLPDWLDGEMWAAWCDERKLRRKPVTARAAAAQIKQLAAYRDQGYSPQEVIEHSIAGGYQGLFAPNRSKNHEASRSANRRETPLGDAMRQHQNILRRIENGTIHEWLADGDDEPIEPWTGSRIEH